MQHDYAFSLPQPDAVSAAHSERCADYIRSRIHDAGGSISFAEFMHYALYAPRLGYYSAGTRNTAPEISPLFGRVIARQCAGVLRNVPGGAILEFGAGSGRLALEVLRTLDELDALPAPSTASWKSPRTCVNGSSVSCAGNSQGLQIESAGSIGCPRPSVV
jgi:hypothetical protein